jgi:Ubiquitin-conjugating enzyme
MSLTLNRLQEERYLRACHVWQNLTNRGSCRKQWRKDHPFGFFAKPIRDAKTGVVDLKKWDCGVPGKDNTIWAGGLFKLEVTFPDGRSCALCIVVGGESADHQNRISHEATKV